MQLNNDGLMTPTQEPPKEDIIKVIKTFENGYKWFYWIAGLSMVNTVAHLLKGNFSFVIGLGIPQIVEGIAMEITKEYPQASIIVNIIAFGFAAFCAGIFALFGFLAGRRHSWAFIVGIVLYIFDGLLFLLVQDWLSIAFHVFAFLCIMSGYTALRKLKQLEALALNLEQQFPQVPQPQNTPNIEPQKGI